MYKLEKIKPATFLLPKEGTMRVPGLIIASEALLKDCEIEKPLQQVRNVAHLPGIVGYSIAMPDIHWGYGFPIGGVAAMDAEEGVISPGGVGYDINCGVRLAVAPLSFRELTDQKRKKLLDTIFDLVPSGVGHGHAGDAHVLSDADYRNLTELGARWSVSKGFGLHEDIEHCESYGIIDGADINAVSSEAKQRGRQQLGTIGSGNHFVEIGEVSHLYLPAVAKAWGIEQGQTYILIHSGSRGFGHQVCQDTLNSFIREGYAKGLPDSQLVAAPLRSEAGKRYFAAMAAAANFAFNNRQRILHAVREAFWQVCKIPIDGIPLIYDVCHNIAKFENHSVNGVPRKLCVHRKGATRAYGPGAHELAAVFRETGQPVLVPGDMGRASHLMVGMGNPLHMVQRLPWRWQGAQPHPIDEIVGRDAVDYMRGQGIYVKASSDRTVAEEMPDAYKDVDAVVEAVEEAALAKRVAKLRPSLVVKG